MNIAIIDDKFVLNKLSPVSLIGEYNTMIETDEYANCQERYDSHGAICASIVTKYCSYAKFYNIIVKSTFSNGNIYSFINGLKHCYNINVDIVHISIGSVVSEDFQIIEDTINQLHQYKPNLLFVAACSNKNIVTFPAYLPHVIGVKYNMRCYKLGIRVLDDNDFGVDIEAAVPYSLNNFGPLKRCNSFAAPVITGLIAEMVPKQDYSDIGVVKNKLKKLVNITY